MLPEHRILLPQEKGVAFSCEEDGATFIENSMIKAMALYKATDGGIPVIADDSGLCVGALDGGPGIHTARYGMVPGGAELSSEERNALLLKNMASYTNEKERKAHFVCALTLIISPWRQFVFQEEVDGHIAFSPYGKGGFGYDPVFVIDSLGQSMAAVSDDMKDRYSHRGRACRHLAALLKEIKR